MSEKIKDLEHKIIAAKNLLEKIDFQNELAWELRAVDTKQSLSIAEETQALSTNNKYNKGLAESLKIQSSIFLILSNYDLSFQKAIGALELFRVLKDKKAEAAVITILGRNSQNLGDYENALKYYLMSLLIYETINEESGIVAAYLNIGNIYGIKKDYDNSLYYFSKALHLCKNHEWAMSSKSILLGNIGCIYGFQKEYQKALEYYFESAKITESNNSNSDFSINYSNIAEVYLLTDDISNAEKYYSKALTVAIDKQNKLSEAVCLLGIGQVKRKLKKTDEAIRSIENAITIAKAHSLNQILADTYLALSEIYFDKEDYLTALKYHKSFYKEKEREFNKEENKKTKSLMVLHQVDALKKESELHRISNDELKKLNENIEDANRRLVESIDYAKHIQDSILPHASNLKQYYADSFVFHRPKDIISGDFFWFYEKENDILISAVDCTGHGVSGALMSIVANSILNQVAANQWVLNPSFMLNEVNHYLQRTLAAHDESGLRDSMDISLCSINKSRTELRFAAAHHSMYHLSGGDFTEYKGDAISIGNNASAKFIDHHISLKKGDVIYIFTDGYADQKGGPARKKFYYGRFKELILKIHEESMNQQKLVLEQTMNEWMKNENQIDDMLIIGIKV